MKVESDVDVQSEGDPIAVNNDVFIPSAFSILKAESEVSCDFRYFLCCFIVLCMCLFAGVSYMWYIICHCICVLKNTVSWNVKQCSLLEIYSSLKLHNASHLDERKDGSSMV